ncbi:MAG: DoxX family membrane protein [Leptolyngbya sp. PLA1]|nr:DoxX family membrane protein [Leptolyngbya sp. PLA1]
MAATFGQRFAPFLLRLSLGTTFLWAGFGKIYADTEVQGERAALLANMGVNAVLGSTGGRDAGGAPAKAETQAPKRVAPEPSPDPSNRPTPKEPLPSGGSPSADAGTDSPLSITPLVALAGQGAAPAHSPDEFPQPVKVKRLYELALGLHAAANPAANSDGKPGMPLWPPAAARGSWPVYLAWAVTLAEVVGGFSLLAGFLTRLGAFSIAVVMAGAIWLTEIGPAVQSGKTWLFVLPDHSAFGGLGEDGGSYMMLLWQITLLAGSLAVLLLGPGCLSLDGLLFGKAPPPPKPAAPKPAP